MEHRSNTHEKSPSMHGQKRWTVFALAIMIAGSIIMMSVVFYAIYHTFDLAAHQYDKIPLS